MSYLEALRRHPFLEGMREAHLARIDACCTSQVSFEPGDTIFRKGQPAGACYLIETGEVALDAETRGGTRTLQTLHEGDVLGWSWMIPPYRWRFDARAITGTTALALKASSLMQAKDYDHDLGYELMKRLFAVVVKRLEATRLQLLEMYAAGE